MTKTFSFLFADTHTAMKNRHVESDPNYRGRAIVSDTIAPDQRGRVHFQGSWWPALCDQDITLAVGEVVQVIGRQNITLLVKPTPSSVVLG